jgi:hypothetical protein
MKQLLSTLALGLVVAGCAGPSPRVAAPTPPPAPAVAAMQFFMPDPRCAPGDPSCLRVIYGIGEITDDTGRQFAAIAAENAAVFATTAGVVLDSPGGTLGGGLLLGDAIRRAGFNTIAGFAYQAPNGTRRVSSCLSACVWAFAGGVNRFMFADGSLGVHRFYGNGSVASAQEVTAYINLYLDRMGVSRVVQDVASLTRSDQMTYLTVAEASRFQLAYITPELARRAGLNRR